MCERPRRTLILTGIKSDQCQPGTLTRVGADLWIDNKGYRYCSEKYGRYPLIPRQARTMEIGELRYVYILNTPCGKCLECLTQKASEWSYRIVNECEQHSENCFITLTYKNNPQQLQPRDFTLFMKNLRKYLNPGKKKCKELGIKPVFIRYFMTGEYGSQRQRPHFHCIIFGWRPKDLTLLQIRGTELLYNSALISKIWGKGFVSVGDVSQYSAKYCAKYLQKLQDIPKNWVQPYVRMSNRPGIGYGSIKKNKNEIFNTDKIYVDGHYKSTPRYYLKCIEKDQENIESVEKLKEERLRVANEFGSSIQKVSSSLLNKD